MDFILVFKFLLETFQREKIDFIGLKVQSSSNDPQRLHQDMADIELLIKNNYPKLDIGLLEEYFSLFGRKKELDKIIKGIEHA